MSQLRIVASKISNDRSQNYALDSIKPKMLRADLPRSPLERKVAELQARRPDLAAVIESLVDDMLDELEGRRL